MLTPEPLSDLSSRIKSYRGLGRSYEELKELEKPLTDLLNDVLAVLRNEAPSYRPLARNGEVGGLLDFTKKRLPVVVVPDLHARPEFLERLLSWKNGELLNALNEGRCIAVCVGDGVHSERYGDVVRAERMNDPDEEWKDDYDRWKESYDAWFEWKSGSLNTEDWVKGERGDSMREEMRLCLATVMAVMELKIAFPEHFHFLKGNHENILNMEGEGDHAFRKFAMEGEMVKDFMQELYDDEDNGDEDNVNAVLKLMRDYETSLPIVAAFDHFCVSHAEPERVFRRDEPEQPARGFGRDEIINYHDEALRDDVVLAFTWTPNEVAEEGSVASIFAELTGGQPEKALWFGGHRPVEGKYALWQDGQYVQIHNPNEMNVAYVSARRPFDVTKDIHSLGGDQQ
ncbi:MAG: hypothetical protein ILP18_10155 [Treponema sp.]|nr:hypothetical protein [Treponema sp.]